MKKTLVAIVLVAAAFFASSYNVEIKITENSAAATCSPFNPTCI